MDEDIIAKYPVLAVSPCKECFQTYIREKEQLKRAIDRLDVYKQSISPKNGGIFISELPDGLWVHGILMLWLMLQDKINAKGAL